MLEKLNNIAQMILTEVESVRRRLDAKVDALRADIVNQQGAALLIRRYDFQPDPETVAALQACDASAEKIMTIYRLAQDIVEECTNAPVLARDPAPARRKRGSSSLFEEKRRQIREWLQENLNADSWTRISVPTIAHQIGVGESVFYAVLKTDRETGKLFYNEETPKSAEYMLSRAPNYAIARAALTAKELAGEDD